MNPIHQVFWTKVAEADLRAIVEYISINNPHNALKILKKIKDKASNLHNLPERGRIVPELQDQGISQYRELIVSPWRLIYRIAEREVYILSVLDSRQNVEDILLKRMTYYDRREQDAQPDG
jgi:addiction module RelE/StbE family toxin